MPKLDLLGLYTRLCGFKVLVRANRFGCDTRFAQVVHDRLLDALTLHIDTCRQAMRLQRLVRVEPDPETREALHQMIGDCLEDLDNGGRGFYPWHLLDSLDPDPDLGGYHHPVAAMWCYGKVPGWMVVSDDHLCGLRSIIDQIAEETGIRFTTYLCDASIGPEGAGELDPVIYEKPIGNYRYQ